MFRPASAALSPLHHGRSVTSTLGALAVAAGLTLVAGCGREVTEPDAVRPIAAEAKPLMVVGTAVNLNNRIVSFMSQRRNSANQPICLDIPWGQAFSNQVVNYFPCHFAPAQQFLLTAWDATDSIPGIWVMIHPISDLTMCLDMRGGTTVGGEHLQLFPCKSPNGAGSGNQIFRLPRAVVAPPNTLGQGLITTICPKAGHPRLALEVPISNATSSFVQQAPLVAAGVDNQWWGIYDVATTQFIRAADVTSSTWRRC